MSGVNKGPDDWRPGIVVAVRKAPTTNGKVCFCSVATLLHGGIR